MSTIILKSVILKWEELDRNYSQYECCGICCVIYLAKCKSLEPIEVEELRVGRLHRKGRFRDVNLKDIVHKHIRWLPNMLIELFSMWNRRQYITLKWPWLTLAYERLDWIRYLVLVLILADFKLASTTKQLDTTVSACCYNIIYTGTTIYLTLSD